MKLQIQRDEFLEKMLLVSKFLPTKLLTAPTLQGVSLKGKNGVIDIYASNLSSYVHSQFKTSFSGEIDVIIDPRKIVEFVTLLTAPRIEVEFNDKQLVIQEGKTKGVFPLVSPVDYPMPPTVKKVGWKIKTDFFKKNLPFLIFSTSQDETRPALSGVLFEVNENSLVMVATDGFRLSLLRAPNELNFPSAIVPADFLSEIVTLIKDEKEVILNYLESEKMIMFKIGQQEFFSRLIQEEFPPYEKVVPSEVVITAVLDRDELIRKIKLVSVFARDFSNVVVMDFKREGVSIRPKGGGGDENVAFEEGEVVGGEQKVAFNFKFVLDFLSKVASKKIKIEILRSDAPVVFKTDDNPNFIHIIMPVRIQEE